MQWHVLIQSQIQLHSYQAVKFNEIHSNRLNLKSNFKKQKVTFPARAMGWHRADSVAGWGGAEARLGARG
jgi:hypothetical protein